MILSDELRAVLQEIYDFAVYDPARSVEKDYVRCLEVESDIRTNAANARFVEIHKDDLETWLDKASSRGTNDEDDSIQANNTIRKLNLLILPIHNVDDYHTPFTTHSLQNAVGLAGAPYDEFRLLSVGPTRYTEVPVENGGIGLIARMEGYNERVIETALMVATSRNCSQSCAVLRVLEKDSMEYFLRRILDLKLYLWHPCILASLQIERRLHKVKEQLEQHKGVIEIIEKRAGLYKAYNLSPEFKRKHGLLQPWNSTEFDSLNSDLASVKHDLLYQRYKCSRFLDHLRFLDDVADRMEELPEYRIKSRFMKSVIVGYEERARYLSDRAETTMQNCFSLMSQKDNYLNQQTAAQSLELTNLSRQDNEHMKQIATASYRHSRDMRAITIITLSFLPATFVATFFSTSFFDFNHDERMASGWLWIYWVVTIVLTGAIMGGWLYFSSGTAEEFSIKDTGTGAAEGRAE